MTANYPYATLETEPEPMPAPVGSIVVPGWIIGLGLGTMLNYQLPIRRAVAFTIASGVGVATAFQLIHWWRLQQGFEKTLFHLRKDAGC